MRMSPYPVVVINLDRSTRRLEQVSKQFQRAGIPFTRLPAVDGARLPKVAIPYFDGSPLGPGEMGCYASHILAWQRIAAGEFGPAALVCEDDIELCDGFAELLGSLADKLPAGWDLARLSSTPKRAAIAMSSLDDNYRLVRYSRQPPLSGAQLVSRAGAGKLLKRELRTRPVDQDFRRPW